MTKVLDEASENTSELNEVKNQKTLCVHDLKKKLSSAICVYSTIHE